MKDFAENNDPHQKQSPVMKEISVKLCNGVLEKKSFTLLEKINQQILSTPQKSNRSILIMHEQGQPTINPDIFDSMIFS